MKFFVDIDIPSPPVQIRHQERILLAGSCFTQHIGNRLAALKFSILQNPNGILFDAKSVCTSLQSYIENTPATPEDLFYYNELWQSWQHHSEFSGQHQEAVVEGINRARADAHHFLSQTGWLIITLGTAFSYRLQSGGEAVANCHRAPAQWFRKHLMEISEIIACLEDTLHRLFAFNPGLKIIFTISPVRHIRDGVTENNRSKARLIEAVHHIVQAFDQAYYFPAYELVIDVLRDYRFYDADLVHPNYAATEYVFDQFSTHYFDPAERDLLEEIRKITTAGKHRSAHPHTEAHQKFVATMRSRIGRLQEMHGYIDFSQELEGFEGSA